MPRDSYNPEILSALYILNYKKIIPLRKSLIFLSISNLLVLNINVNY